MVPHNAHVGRIAEGRPLLLHCLGTPSRSIAQPAFRDQIMTSTDINGLLFKPKINSRTQCGNLVCIRKFTLLGIWVEFLSLSYVKLIASSGGNVGRDSSVGIATRYGLDYPGIANVQTGPGTQPASCTKGIGSFSGVKWPGRGVDHPAPSSAEVRERVKLYLYSPCEPSRQVTGCTLQRVTTFKPNSRICNTPE